MQDGKIACVLKRFKVLRKGVRMLFSMHVTLPREVDVDIFLKPHGKSRNDLKNGKIDLFHFCGISYAYEFERFKMVHSDLEFTDCTSGFLALDYQDSDLHGLAFLSMIAWSESARQQFGGTYYGIYEFISIMFINTEDKLFVSKDAGFTTPSNMDKISLSKTVEYLDCIYLPGYGLENSGT